MRRTDSQQWTAVSLLLELVRKYVTPAKEPTQSFAFIHILFWLIRSLVDPTLIVFIVCGPLQLVTHKYIACVASVFVQQRAKNGVFGVWSPPSYFCSPPVFTRAKRRKPRSPLLAVRKCLLRRLINIILIISNATRSPKLLPKRHFRLFLTLQNIRFFFPIRKARVILACEAREPHTLPLPFLHSLPTFPSNINRVARVCKK